MKKIMVFALLVYCAEPRMVNDQCYGVINLDSVDKQVLKRDIGSPYQLAIEYATNNLFFSYTNEKSGKSTFESAYVNLDTNEFKIIKGIVGGFANAVDTKNHIVYLGGENGLYTFDYESNVAKHIDGTTHKVWQMFFKKDLYYTKYPEEEIYVFKNGKSQRLHQLIHTRGTLVALDNNENIYFSNSSGLFFQEQQNEKPGVITYVGDYIINGFTSDIHGNLFFSTPNAIFAIDDKSKSPKQLISIEDIYGVAIERNGNIIYAAEDSIVRLKTKKIQC